MNDVQATKQAALGIKTSSPLPKWRKVPQSSNLRNYLEVNSPGDAAAIIEVLKSPAFLQNMTLQGCVIVNETLALLAGPYYAQNCSQTTPTFTIAAHNVTNVCHACVDKSDAVTPLAEKCE